MTNNKDSFFSMDRLVEFGMGMAMSQQIVQNMNNMMAGMKQPPLAQSVYQPLNGQAQPLGGQTLGVQPQKTWNVAPQQVSQSSAAAMQAVAEGSAGISVIVPPPLPQESQTAAQTVQPLPEVFYISVENGKAEGPYSGTEIARLVTEKKVTAQTPVWKTGMAQWKTAADFPDLVAIIALVPPEMQNNK